MKVEYTGRQTTINKKLRAQAESGLAQIAKLVGRTASAHVILTEDKYRQIAEVTVKSRGQSLVATCKSGEMGMALHDALGKIEKQAIRHRQRTVTLKRHPKGEPKEVVVQAALAEVPVRQLVEAKKAAASSKQTLNGSVRKPKPVVVQTPSKKTVMEPHVIRSIDSAAMIPMTFEEAVKEAALRNRSVFVFRDHSGLTNVLHCRRDGTVELIEVPC